jgi:biotin carboxyl carrier protein
VHLAAAVACAAARRRAHDRLAPPGFRTLHRAPRARGTWNGYDVAYRLHAATGETTLELDVDGTEHALALRHLRPEGVRVRLAGVEYPCVVATHGDEDTVWVDDAEGGSVWRRPARLPAPEDADASGGPVSEVPGTVVEVLVAPGELVSAGQKLVVLEAMKMEHPSLASVDGVVEAVHVAVGQYVEPHTTLVTLAAESEAPH